MYVIISDQGIIQSAQNQANRIPLPEGLVVPANGVFLEREKARAFAEVLARRYPGHKFHLLGREGMACTVLPEVKWEDTP
jgi:hypothetical protein